MQKILVGYWRLCQDLITRICFTSYIKNVQIQKYHSKHILYALPCFLQIQICLTLKKSIILLNGEDFLSKMWLTKVFGCNYNRQKKRDYSNLINANVMNSLLQDTSIQRYALWAFSTLEKVNVKVIEINPYDAKITI